jgi:hypothetical protein
VSATRGKQLIAGARAASRTWSLNLKTSFPYFSGWTFSTLEFVYYAGYYSIMEEQYIAWQSPLSPCDVLADAEMDNDILGPCKYISWLGVYN